MRRRRVGSYIGLIAVMLVGVCGCVTETHNSVYTKEYSKDAAVQSRVDAAMDYMRMGDTDNAIRHLRAAYDMDKGSAAVNNGLALAFQINGEKGLAEQHYKTALRANSGMTSARNNYGVFLYGEERYPEACRHMRRVIKDTLYEGRADAFHNLGQCEMRLGNVSAAEEAFTRSLALNRNHTGAMLELADIHLSQGSYSKAMQFYQLFDQRSEQNPRSLYVGIRLAEQFEEYDTRASYVMALKNLYPHSAEYQRYKKENRNDAAK